MSIGKNEYFDQFVEHWKKVGYENDNYDGYNAKGVQIPINLLTSASEYYVKLRSEIEKHGKELSLPFIGPYDDENTIVMQWSSKKHYACVIIGENNKVSTFITIHLCEDYADKCTLDNINPECVENFLKMIEEIEKSEIS